MGTTNFELFKQRLEAAANAGKSTKVGLNWFKPVGGKRHVLRFLPLKHEQFQLPIAMYHHHSMTFPDGHFESIPCNKKLGAGECPFCKEASRLYRKFTSTEDKAYLEAAKALFPKSHYLLVGYDVAEVSSLSPEEITSEHLKVVRASSKANMDLLDSKLMKGVDFVDRDEGRNVTLLKNTPSGKNAITTITWDFDDPSQAFTGRNAGKMWQALLDASPDLASTVNAVSESYVNGKFAEWSTQPADAETSDDVIADSIEPPFVPTKTLAPTTKAMTSDSSDVNDDVLARLREELG